MEEESKTLKELHNIWQAAKAKLAEFHPVYQGLVAAAMDAEQAYHEAAAKLFSEEKK